MAPSFRVKLPDSILDILYKCIIGTNSLSADSSKRSRKTGPSLPKRRLLAAILLNDDVEVLCHAVVTSNWLTCLVRKPRPFNFTAL